MRTREEFVEEYLSDKCMYWTETVEDTNKVLEVAKRFGIKFRSGHECDAVECAMSLLTFFVKDGVTYIQRNDMWNPAYGLNVRSERCMFAEFHELKLPSSNIMKKTLSVNRYDYVISVELDYRIEKRIGGAHSCLITAVGTDGFNVSKIVPYNTVANEAEGIINQIRHGSCSVDNNLGKLGFVNE